MLWLVAAGDPGARSTTLGLPYPPVLRPGAWPQYTTPFLQPLNSRGGVHEVFSAFDESLLFKPNGTDSASTAVTLKKEFKLVFQNISRLLDCVSCQKCRLHGKMQLLGLGTSLQVLLLPEHLIASSLSKDELVSLFNTVGKLSAASSGFGGHAEAEAE